LAGDDRLQINQPDDQPSISPQTWKFDTSYVKYDMLGAAPGAAEYPSLMSSV